MSGYIGTKAVTLSTTSASVGGDSTVGGDLTVDTNTLYVDSASNNIGVGVSSPSYPMTIASASNAVGLAINGRSADGLGAAYWFANNGTTQHGDIRASASEFRISSTPASAVQTFYTNGSERLRILSSGGITFNGDTAAANALDDYEEGTWTPVLGGSSGESGQSYTSQDGAYTKVGSLVYCSAWINVTSIGTVSGSYALLTGLPFTVGSGNKNYGGGVIQHWSGFGVNSAGFTIYAEPNQTYCYIHYRSSFGTLATYLTPAGWGTSPNLMVTITYRTDA